MKRAFSLVELMMVIALLGILAAIILPTFKGHVTEAKKATAKDNLRIYRSAIELYTAHHNDPPGYLNGLISTSSATFLAQLMYTTDQNGQLSGGSEVKTATYPFGPYLKTVPENPFNNRNTISVLGAGEDFPASATGQFGWVYQPQTKSMKLDWPGTDSEDIPYFDY